MIFLLFGTSEAHREPELEHGLHITLTHLHTMHHTYTHHTYMHWYVHHGPMHHPMEGPPARSRGPEGSYTSIVFIYNNPDKFQLARVDKFKFHMIGFPAALIFHLLLPIFLFGGFIRVLLFHSRVKCHPAPVLSPHMCCLHQSFPALILGLSLFKLDRQ